MVDVLTRNQTFASPQEALAHYGVKGMKWGVRKDDRPARSDRRAAGYDKKVARTQKEIDRIQALPKSKWSYVQKNRDSYVRDLEQYKSIQQKNADDIRAGSKLTDSQRKILIGAGVAAGVLAAYGTYKYIDSGQLNARKGEEWKKREDLKGEKSIDDIMHDVVTPINRGYGGLGTKMNCRRCTFAYEMRRRGNDVQATKSSSATGQHVGGLLNATEGTNYGVSRLSLLTGYMKEMDSGGPLTDALEGKTSLGKNPISFGYPTPSAKASQIFSALSSHSNGARGEISVAWIMGGAHSMAWEIVGGKPVIIDAQTGKKWTDSRSFETVAQNMKEAGFTRLDNIPLNEQFLRRWLANAH